MTQFLFNVYFLKQNPLFVGSKNFYRKNGRQMPTRDGKEHKRLSHMNCLDPFIFVFGVGWKGLVKGRAMNNWKMNERVEEVAEQVLKRRLWS